MTARFSPQATAIPGLLVLDRHPLVDGRGRFERLFDLSELAALGYPGPVAQVNRSLTAAVGSVRGMHLQLHPHAEWKVITCLRGAVMDVVVDLRRGSPAFLRWHAVELGQHADRTLLVPPGCAHGFQVLQPDSEMIYLHSAPYAPGVDAGVRADDPRLAIAWPLPIAERSARDMAHPLIEAGFTGYIP